MIGATCISWAPSVALDQRLEGALLVRLQVDEEQARRALGQAQVDLGGEIAVDQGDHREHGETGAERDDDARRAGARPVQVGERDPRARPAAPADQPDAAQDQGREPGQQDRRRERHADEDQPDPAIGDAGQRQARKTGDAEPEERQDRRRRPARRRRDQGPEHAGRRDRAGARERPDRERERGQKTGAERDQERQRIPAGHDLDRQQRRHQRAQQPGRRLADREAEQAADPGQHQDLQEIDPEHEAARGAEALERRDGRGPAGQIVLDRERHADPADQQRGQAGERQIGREPVGEAGDLGLDVAGAARPPAGIRMLGPDPGEEGVRHRRPWAGPGHSHIARASPAAMVPVAAS